MSRHTVLPVLIAVLGATPALAHEPDRVAPVREAPADPSVDPVARPAEFGAERPILPGPAAEPAASGAEVVRAEALRLAAANARELRFDTDELGSVWVRGATYKASFDARGVTYVPFFGSRAPRNFPVRFELESAVCGDEAIALSTPASALREGSNVRIDRGSIDEVWEMSLEAAEQTFVLEERPVGGDLLLRVSIESELSRGESAHGLDYANEHGRVRYGRAFVREADGTRTPVASRLVDGGIEIEVARDMLDRASYPLTIDPIVSTFVADSGDADHLSADVSYDLSTDRYLVVYSEVFSASDYDVAYQLRNGLGSSPTFDYIDMTSQNWYGNPCCANLNTANQFLVVCTANGVPGTENSVIRGRTINPSPLVLGASFNISPTGLGGTRWHCDVGGDPYIGTAYYCVVWETANGSTEADIYARLVAPDSTLLGSGPIAISTSVGTLDKFPRVSESNGQLGSQAAWNIVWQRNTTTNLGEVLGAQLDFSGALMTAPFFISSGTLDDTGAEVSSPRADGTYMATWVRDYGPDYDVMVALLDGSTVLDVANMSLLEGSSTATRNQAEVDVDTDGVKFNVVYSDGATIGSYDYDVRLTSLHTLANDIGVSESRLPIDTFSARQTRARTAAAWSSGATTRRSIVGWDSIPALGSDGDIEIALHDTIVGGPLRTFCAGDGSGTACPCGNNGAADHGCANSANAAGARLSPTGNADISADTVLLTALGMPANVTCTYFQGTSANLNGTVFGDGLRCAVGSTLRLRTENATASGTSDFPTGAEGDLSDAGFVPAGGGRRYYQLMYRNSALFCTTATFNTTNGVDILWLP